MGYMKELDIRIRNGGDDAIAAACELMPQWIQFFDRCPDEGERVIVFAKSANFVGEGVPCGRAGLCATDVGAMDCTHWMPLPAPPTDSK